MFYDCSSLTNIDLSNWNTSNVTDMSSMFYNCKSLTNIDLSSWNTSNVTDMSSMFYNCNSLTNINLRNWNTRNVTDMYRMFYNCSSLTNIDLSSWNVSSVETTYEMFSNCSSLANVNLSNWNTSNLIQTSRMFYNCKTIEQLDVSTFDLSRRGNYLDMFEECSFNILVTPKATSRDFLVSLPYIMYDEYGEEYIFVPTTSKTLYKERPNLKYNITLKTNGGIINSGNISEYTGGTGAILPTDVSKVGYTFSGWYDNEELAGSPVTSISATETGDKTYYAKWVPATDTPYTVEYYKQNTQLNGYDLTETEEKTGTTGQLISIETINIGVTSYYEGFELNTSKSIQSGVIEADGSLVLKLYFDRKTYSVTLKPEGGIIPEGKEITSYIHGIVQTLPEPTRVGYTFEGWYNNTSPVEQGERVTTVGNGVGAKIFEAKWTANTNTPYKVIHHFRNLDTEVEGYNEEEELKTGTTDTTVEAEYKQVEGFTKNESDSRTVKEGTVAGDGSLELHLYYTRNTYNIIYELNGGTTTNPLTSTYTYGKEMILQTNRVIKQGYEFAGWYDNEELAGSPVTSIPATSIGDKTFYAKWTKNIFTVTFKDGTGRTEVQTINKGENATAPNWTKPGYTLTWDTEFTNVTSDITVNAIWTANTNTPYKVIHHFRNLDTEVEGYNEEEELKTGTTDATVEAEYKQVEGFTKNESDSRTVKEGTVAGDGSLVLHLYYARNTYNIVYELNGGTTISSLTNKYIYGKEMILQTKVVTKQGYVFAGWYDNEELTGSPVTSISATSTGDKTFYAKWVEEEKEYYILSEAYNIDLTENIITKVSPETSVTNFLSEIETNGQKKVVNAKGEEVTNTTLVGTGYKLQVTFKGEVHTYEIAVRGDLDGNGKITTTDLSIINQQILHKIELTGIKAKAADTDFNGNLTTTDLSMINQAVLRKINL